MFTVLIYTALVLIGWISIYAAVYNEEHHSIFSMSERYGKQLIWIGTSVFLAVLILVIDSNFYSTFAYPIYGIVMFILILVLLFGTEINGATSWFKIGGFALQPSEFAKFATGLALAKYLSTLNIKFEHFKTKVMAIAIIAFPALLILLQNDTGSTLVYTAFIFVLFREGLSGNVLLLGFYAAVIFVLTLILRLKSYTYFGYELSGEYTLAIIVGIIAGFLYFLMRKVKRSWIIISVFLLATVGMILSVDYAMEHVLKEHHANRINVMLGLKHDPHGVGYNLEQSLIAIGSGGFSGKGFLEGTQTKFDFVPEQSTDFIFCTIGEEWGFLGTMITIILFCALLLRIIFLAEQQRSTFSRIYGYCVASILFFHMAINIGMTIGLAPVIGIPLPLISYGGSSLWAFTILIFIFLKLDANKLQIFR